MKRFIIFLYSALFLIVFFTSCENNAQNEKLYLSLIASDSLSLALDSVLIDHGINLSIDSNQQLEVIYINNAGFELMQKNLHTGKVKSIHKFEPEEINQLICFKLDDGNLIYLLRNDTIVIKINEQQKKYIHLNIDSSEFVKCNLQFPSEFKNNYIYMQYGIENQRTFIGKYSDFVLSLNKDGSILWKKYICPFPEKYSQNVQHYRNAIRTLGNQYIYYTFEKTDSVLTYDYNDLDNIKEKTDVFNDLIRMRDIPYDTSKIRDMAYLKKYTQTTELNIPTFQKQDSNKVFLIKRLPKSSIENPDQFVIGLVVNNKYIGYAKLPDDFNSYLHYITNENLYYISTKELKWKHYTIKLL